MIKRRLKIAALIVGLLLALVLAFLAWVLYTEAGLRFAVARLPERMGKVTLHIERVYGTIAGGFGADLADIDSERTRVRVEKGSASVNFWPLLVGRISVRAAARRARGDRGQAPAARRHRRCRRNSCRGS